MRLLDLFCGAGGSAEGYRRAGFTEIVGVDTHRQRRYPFEFVLGDALDFPLDGFDVIHASPPCQAYSDLAHRTGRQYVDLVAATRARLVASGADWVIENVEGAPLADSAVLLCGTMFPALRVIRHRLFESNVDLPQPPHLHRRDHPLVHTTDKRKPHYGQTDPWTDYVGVTGGGNCTRPQGRKAMDIDWMTKRELNQAIPPPYTALVGRALRDPGVARSADGGPWPVANDRRFPVGH